MLLQVDDLAVHLGGRPLLRPIGFQLAAGECLVLLGESGAGKSLLAQAIMGNLPHPLQASGRITLHGQEVLAVHAQRRRPWWGRQLAMLPQEPAVALDALQRLMPQLQETYALVGGLDAAQARSQSHQSLQAVGLVHARARYPWQLSGGMAQRAAALVARAGGARVLLADEPTKGLDARWCDQMIESLQALQRAGGAVVVITHDLRVARALGGQLMVMRGGEVVEQGPTAQVLSEPTHPFTLQLLAADPARWPARALSTPRASGEEVLKATRLSQRRGGRVLFEDLDLSARRGQRLVVQGPSGVGKSTLGDMLLGLMPPDRGQIWRTPGLHALAFQKLYQDPVLAFAPQVSLKQSLQDVARRHACGWKQVQTWMAELKVSEELLERRPAQVSGGELQRLAMARVLCTRPAFLFADEPTSRLDVLTQAETVQALLRAVDEVACALLLVTHDDDLARSVGDVCLRLEEAQAH
jgi:peptide/nickel transport system ATP-binding protein